MGINLEVEEFGLLLSNLLTWLDIFVISLGIRSFKKNLQMFLAPEISWSSEYMSYIHAGIRNHLSFISFEFSTFLCL